MLSLSRLFKAGPRRHLSAADTAPRKAASRRGRRPSSRAPRVEPLEDRVLLSLQFLGQWNQSIPRYSDGWMVGEFAFIAHYGHPVPNNNGVHIIYAGEPWNPIETANFLSTSGWNDFRDLQVHWQYVNNEWKLIGYASSDIGGGLIIADFTDVFNPVDIFRITAAHGGTNTVHTFSYEDGYLYEADSRTATVRIFDVSNPWAPRHVRNFQSNTGDAVHEVTVQWGRLYTAGIWGTSSAEIWDVSQIGQAPPTYLGRINGAALGAMAHTTWPSYDGQFMAVAREAAGGDLSIWNISNPAAPTLAWRLGRPIIEAGSVHQVMIRGNLMFVSWYQAGLFVYDITDPYNPVEVGSYDTYPGPGCGGCYAGAWGIFGSDYDWRIAGFDMQSGLFFFYLDGSSPSGSGGQFQGSDSRAVRGSAGVGLPVEALRPDQIANFGEGALTLTLGAGNDTVIVSRNVAAGTIDVVVNNLFRFSYNAAQVQTLNVRALEGDDQIILDPNLGLRLFLDGGPGDDVVDGWLDSYVNPPAVHQNNQHAAKITPYQNIAVERLQVVQTRAGGVGGVGSPVDYSAHQLLDHTGAAAGQGLSGALRMIHAGESVFSSLGLTAGHAQLTPRLHTSMASVAGMDHLIAGVARQVAWHKPWCT